MKKRDIQALKNKSLEELQKLFEDNQEKLRKLSFDLSTNKLKNIKEIKEVKRLNARILTFMNQIKSNNK
jgi:ribosomal protein L29